METTTEKPVTKWVFNINRCVKVKLTDLGYQRLADQYNSCRPPGRKETDAAHFKLRADKDGYTRFQMWVFMEAFGPVTAMAGPSYYNTNIVIESDDLNPLE